MAYQRGYNPDALPAHAEPDQGMNRPHAGSTSSSNYNKPAPPPPQQQQYGRGSPSQGYQQQPPGGYSGSPGPPQNQGYQGQGQGGYQGQGQGGGYQQNQGYQNQNQGGPPNQGYQNQGPPPGGYQNQGGGYNSNQPPPPQQQQQRYGSQGGYGQNPPPQQQRPNLTSPPPPQNYGQGPPPQGYHNRPPIPEQQRPPTVAPPRDGNDRDALWPLFLQVDKDRTGQLTEPELQRALVNGDYTAFDPHTVKMMIRMFDTDRSGTINFDEFCGLWSFLSAWRNLFDRFDADRSGNINLREFEDALVAFGYRLSPNFVQLLFGTFAKSHSRGRGDEYERQKVLSFDLFVQACISLKRMTDVFKKYDTDRDGYITLSFEEFLTGAQGLFLFNSISPRTDTGLY